MSGGGRVILENRSQRIQQSRASAFDNDAMQVQVNCFDGHTSTCQSYVIDRNDRVYTPKDNPTVFLDGRVPMTIPFLGHRICDLDAVPQVFVDVAAEITRERKAGFTLQRKVLTIKKKFVLVCAEYAADGTLTVYLRGKRYVKAVFAPRTVEQMSWTVSLGRVVMTITAQLGSATAGASWIDSAGNVYTKEHTTAVSVRSSMRL